MSIDGILNVLKPPDKTSFQVVSLVRQLSSERHVGHTGTLDPYATGVLPVCLGQATRVIEFMSGDSKTYRAEVQLGATTDTYDFTGTILEACDPSAISEVQVKSTLEAFRGAVMQIPPMYSAIKHQGRPLYQLARMGIEVPRKPREVHIYRLELVGWRPPVFVLEVECSSGTYIRSLAHDIGHELGCGAFIKELVRLRCGRFEIKDAVPLASLEEAFCDDRWSALLHPMDEVLMDWAAVIVDDAAEKSIRNGRLVALEGAARQTSQGRWADWCRAYSTDGQLLALLNWQSECGLWHPSKVFHRGCCPREGSSTSGCQCCPEGEIL